MNVTHLDHKRLMTSLFIVSLIILATFLVFDVCSDDSQGEIQLYETGDAGPSVTWKYNRYSGLLSFEGNGIIYDYEIITDDPKDPLRDPPKWSRCDARAVVFGEGITEIGKSALR